MKKFLVPILSVVILIVLFIGGLLAFNGVKFQNDYRTIKEAYPDMTSFELISDKDYEFQELKVDEKVVAKVYATYKIFKNSKEVGFVYFVTSNGYKPDIKIALGFNTSTKKITGIKVLEHSETRERYALLKDSFFKQFKNKSFDERLFTINKVSNATLTSVGFENAMIVARLQFAHDKKWTIPAPVLVEDYYQNISTLNLIYEFEYNAEKYVVTFDQNYNFVSSDKDLDQELKDLLTSVAKTSPLTNLIKSVQTADNVTTLVVTAKGYGGTISGTITYDLTAKKFTGFVVDQHSESENYGKVIIDGNYTGDLINDSNTAPVSGMTVTSNALKKMLELAQEYVDEVINHD